MGITLILEWIVFVLLGINTLYLFSFAFASIFNLIPPYPHNNERKRILVLFPAYKEDTVIVSSVKSFLKQDYPNDLYNIVVISDHMKEETNNKLSTLPIKLLTPIFKHSSKANALKYAINNSEADRYDIIVILDADNSTDPHFLNKINDAMAKERAVQCHRCGKNRNTSIAVLDSISEEINNSIFRKGHVNVGLSSALIGSGMAFEAKWFISKVEQLCTSGEDKELETLLLKDRIHIGYLPEVNIYDEKTQKSSNFYNQRRRWIATQFFSFFRSTKEFFPALLHGNIDYIDKLIQWTLLPRIILLGFTSIFALIASFTKLPFFYKWWGLLGIIIITFCISIPKKHWDKKLFRAIIQVPLLFALMVANLFRIKGANKTFIHTEKNYENSN